MTFLSQTKKLLFEKNIIHRPIYSDRLSKATKSSNLVVLQGQRRVGKSYVVLDFLKSSGVDHNKVFFCNKEFDINDEIPDAKSLNNAFNEFVLISGEPEYLVIDEIQEIENREKFVRAKLVSKNYKIIITGSNSKLLSGDLTTYLTGRFLTLQVFPFDYKEYIQYKKLSNSNESLLEYIVSGGMPETLFLPDENLSNNYIKNTMESIIFRDIIKRYSVRDGFLLEKVIGFLATTQGKLVTINNIVNYISDKYLSMKGISANTISSYIEYIKDAYLVNKVKRYDIRGKRQFELNDKYYFTEHSIKNLFGYNTKFDVGTILEGLVLNKLLKDGYSVFVGQLGAKEIDFIAVKGDQRKYIQVCYMIGDNEQTFEREFGNLQAINDNYPKTVISCDPLIKGNINGVEWVRMIDFLMN